MSENTNENETLAAENEEAVTTIDASPSETPSETSTDENESSNSNE